MSKLQLLLKTLIITSLAVLPMANSARILGVFPYPSKSHMTVFSTLTRELARRGHEMVVVSSFPLSKPMLNYTDIDIMDVMAPLHEIIFNADVYDFADFSLYMIPTSLWDEGLAVTEAALTHPKINDLLKDNKGFDLIIAEAFIHEAIYGFAHHFKAPLILISSMNGMHWVNYVVGTPIPLSYFPNPMLTYTDHMTFSERIVNSVFTSLWDLGNQLHYLPRQEALKKAVFGESCASISELEKSVSLVLLNNHLSLNFPRPLVPSMIDAGGMHVSTTTSELPNDIKKFLDDAKEGVIYFSMGSNLRSDKMPAEKLEAFMNAFSEIPQRVLWKWESDEFPGKPRNVKVSKWLPQQDILAHRNVKLFITHGGLLSLQEAAYHGVPLIGIPVYGDQMLNMKKAVLGGYGVMVTLQNVTKQSLLWALDKTLNDPSISMEAKRRSSLFRDQPESPLDRAVFWTEYVLRHKGAHHLRTAATELAWYQLNLLDVAAVLLGALLLSFFVLRTFARLVFCKPTIELKNNNNEKRLHKKRK
ncbi:UDP-glycosyltransferase-12 [Ephemera danica]|nr:UDP-glycosyltransferase-12 [Ephemera danica]